MAVDLSETLVVGVSATALFDLSEADRVFQEKQLQDRDTAIAEYRKYMMEREDEPLGDGTAMPLVRALLRLNDHQPSDSGAPLVEVVIISRNSPETGMRVLKQIRKRNLNITRMAFTAGEDVVKYLDSFYVDLFLTTNEVDAQGVVDSGVCAAGLVRQPPRMGKEWPGDEVRFAFDADAVVFDESSEFLHRTEGIDEFWRSEDEAQDIPLPEGPHANLLRKLYRVQERLGGRIEYSPVRIAIVTARSAPAEMRVLKTLRRWGVYVDQAFFLGGLNKTRFLKAFRPHIFFDDQDSNLDPAAPEVPSAKVLYPSHSPLHQQTNPQQTSEVGDNGRVASWETEEEEAVQGDDPQI